MRVRTDYWPKPIPTNQFDWSAVTDEYDAEWLGEEDGWHGNQPIGHGATKQQAIADLLEAMTVHCICEAGCERCQLPMLPAWHLDIETTLAVDEDERHCEYQAIDLNTFDPERMDTGGWRGGPIGRGATKEEAIADLLIQMQDEEENDHATQ